MNKRESDAIGIVLHLPGQMVVVSVVGMHSILMQRPNPTFSVGAMGNRLAEYRIVVEENILLFQDITLRKEY